jgi:hypothetical protein
MLISSASENPQGTEVNRILFQPFTIPNTHANTIISSLLSYQKIFGTNASSVGLVLLCLDVCVKIRLTTYASAIDDGEK